MIDSIMKAASELKDKVATKSEVVKILNEATNNDNWNISNSKLQVLADHTYDWNDYNVIMKHLWSKLSLNKKEWRKIFKALHAIDYLLKNGAPRIIQDIRDDLYKIRSLQDMEYVQVGKDKCSGIREKAKQIWELISDQEQLEEEREFARKNRDKFAGIGNTGSMSSMGAPSMGGMGGIGSNSKFQGFGSDDLKKYSGGYNLQSTRNAGYDPYQKKGGSVFDGTGKKKEKDSKKGKDKNKKKGKTTKKKKKQESSEEDSEDSDEDSDEDSNDEDSDEESSEEEKPKKKTKKSEVFTKPKRKQTDEGKVGKKAAPKKEQAPAKQPDLFDLLDTDDTPAPQTARDTSNLESLGLDFGQPASSQVQQQQHQNMFQNMNMPAQQDQNNMFANMNVAASGQTSNNNAAAQWSSWGTAATAQTQQPGNSSVSNITNTVNLFGNMNISQPVNQTKPDTQATASFNMFEGMSHSGSQMSSPPPQQNIKTQEQTGIDDFGDFQDSHSVSSQSAKPAPKKDDAWSMGGGLFNLGGLKKDSEKQDKLGGGYPKHSPEKNLLHTHGEDLNNIWSSAIASQNPASSGSGMGGGSGFGNNYGYSGSGMGSYNQPSNNFGSNNQGFSTGFGQNSSSTSGFGQSNQSMGGFGQSSQPTGGFWQNSSSMGGFGQSNQSMGGFGQSNQSMSGFGQNNQSTSGMGGFSGFPNNQQNTSSNSGFPNTGGFPQQNNQWSNTQGNSGGFVPSNNQNPFM